MKNILLAIIFFPGLIFINVIVIYAYLMRDKKLWCKELLDAIVGLQFMSTERLVFLSAIAGILITIMVFSIWYHKTFILFNFP